MVMDKSVLNKKIKLKKAGFTLVEIMVALMIFTVFITIALSALMISNKSSKKATAIKTAIDNVQYGMELFTRTARLGTMYNCFDANQSSVIVDTTKGVDCSITYGQGVAFLLVDPTVTPNQTDLYAYYLENQQGDGRIMRCVEKNIFPGGALPTSIPMNLYPNITCASLTAQEIDIDQFELIVTGTDPVDILQPSIKVKIGGIVRTNDNTTTPFSLQTFISQRQYE